MAIHTHIHGNAPKHLFILCESRQAGIGTGQFGDELVGKIMMFHGDLQFFVEALDHRSRISVGNGVILTGKSAVRTRLA